jgi:Methylase involved in ubiquinone/menaquinone biosynthesis
MPDDPNGFARDLFDGLPARYDRLAELLSFGQNGQWRAEMVGHVVPADGVILDVASGTAAWRCNWPRAMLASTGGPGWRAWT